MMLCYLVRRRRRRRKRRTRRRRTRRRTKRRCRRRTRPDEEETQFLTLQRNSSQVHPHRMSSFCFRSSVRFNCTLLPKRRPQRDRFPPKKKGPVIPTKKHMECHVAINVQKCSV